jgi:putative ABC transport system permease protein
VVAGRSFSPNFPSDALVAPTAAVPATTAAFILNEAAAKQLGWPISSAVGRRLELGRDPSFSSRAAGPVVGVVNDTSFESVRVRERPIVYALYPALVAPRFFMINGLSIRVASSDLAGTLRRIDATWAKFHPEFPIARRFLDADFEALYRDDARDGRMLGAFALLAVCIAALGLLGLTWFATETRTKEIGIRKAIGGTVWDIVRLFVMQLDGLVLVAAAIACPIAYFAMQRWLSGFAYRVATNVWLYVGGTAVALLVATLTVGLVAARAATTKPLRALRNE